MEGGAAPLDVGISIGLLVVGAVVGVDNDHAITADAQTPALANRRVIDAVDQRPMARALLRGCCDKLIRRTRSSTASPWSCRSRWPRPQRERAAGSSESREEILVRCRVYEDYGSVVMVQLESPRGISRFPVDRSNNSMRGGAAR